MIQRKRERLFAVLPTMLTLGNAFAGFAAITFAAKLGPEEVQPAGEHLWVAAAYIFVAMLFDMLDGRVARWAHQQSEFGAQLDSLCDVISFGVAPAFLVRQFSARSVFHPRILWAIAALYVVCAVLRLARFNAETDEDDTHESFSGLPSPAAAGVIASFPIAMHAIGRWFDPASETSSELARIIGTWLQSALVQLLPIFTLAVACLMVSQFRYAHVFNQLFTGRQSRKHVIQIVFAAGVVFMVRELAIPLIFCWFAFYTPIRSMWRRLLVVRFRRARGRPVQGEPHVEP